MEHEYWIIIDALGTRRSPFYQTEQEAEASLLVSQGYPWERERVVKTTLLQGI